MKIAIVLLAAALSATPLLAQDAPMMAERMAPRPQIVTSGEGEARVTPDRARIMLGVQTRATTAAVAAADNARRQRAVIDTLKALGVPANLISTTGYTVYPETQFDKDTQRPRVTGYVVSNVVQAELRRIDLVGPAIDGALAKGANQVNSLQFFASNADDVHRAALADAVAKARADADAMARAAGGTIGELIELSEAGQYQQPILDREFVASRMAAGAPTPIEPGEATIHASVSARWQFVPSHR